MINSKVYLIVIGVKETRVGSCTFIDVSDEAVGGICFLFCIHIKTWMTIYIVKLTRRTVSKAKLLKKLPALMFHARLYPAAVELSKSEARPVTSVAFPILILWGGLDVDLELDLNLSRGYRHTKQRMLVKGHFISGVLYRKTRLSKLVSFSEPFAKYSIV